MINNIKIINQNDGAVSTKKEINQYNIIKMFFWSGLWQKLLLIATLEIIAHTSIRYFTDDWSYPKILHLIGWFFLGNCLFNTGY